MLKDREHLLEEYRLAGEELFLDEASGALADAYGVHETQLHGIDNEWDSLRERFPRAEDALRNIRYTLQLASAWREANRDEDLASYSAPFEREGPEGKESVYTSPPAAALLTDIAFGIMAANTLSYPTIIEDMVQTARGLTRSFYSPEIGHRVCSTQTVSLALLSGRLPTATPTEQPAKAEVMRAKA